MNTNTFKNVRNRNGIIYIYTTYEKQRYRFSTGISWDEKEAKKIDTLYIQYIEKYKKTLEQAKTDNETVRFGDIANEALEKTAKFRKNQSQEEYRNILKNKIMPFFGEKPFEDISYHDIEDWQEKFEKNGLSIKQIKKYRIVLRIVLDRAGREFPTVNNILSLVPPPRHSKDEIYDMNSESGVDINPFSMKEIDYLISNAKTEMFRNFLIISFFSGLRDGELLALKWDDVDFEQGSISITKRMRKGEFSTPKTISSKRKIIVLPLVVEALKSQYKITGEKKSGFIMLNQYDRNYMRMDKIISYKWKPLFKKINKELGVEIDYRDIKQTRHTFASMMISRGEDITWVSKVMGHKDSSTTLKYYAKYIPEEGKRHAVFTDELALNWH